MAKVINSRWWTPGPPAGPLLGAVLCQDEVTGEMKVYIGAAIGADQAADEHLISQWGAKVDPGLGKAMFPAHADWRWADE